ncbi:MAG: hypothetical protein ABR578_13415 [Chromatocurvus sp.]
MTPRKLHAASRGMRRQSGAILILAGVFVFLLTYLALSSVDLAAVESRMADAVRLRAEARTLLDAAVRIIVPGETARLQQALARGDAPVCETTESCVDTSRSLILDGFERYRVAYETRVREPAPGGRDRVEQAAVSSAVRYRSARYEIDIRVVSIPGNAILARTGVGIHVSEARKEVGGS